MPGPESSTWRSPAWRAAATASSGVGMLDTGGPSDVQWHWRQSVCPISHGFTPRYPGPRRPGFPLPAPDEDPAAPVAARHGSALPGEALLSAAVELPWDDWLGAGGLAQGQQRGRGAGARGAAR